jgi:hypothetical protein
MSAAEKLRRTASQLLAVGVDPYNTAAELARQAEQLADFADWVREIHQAETNSLLRRQAE